MAKILVNGGYFVVHQEDDVRTQWVKQIFFKTQDGWVVRVRDIGDGCDVSLISHHAQVNNYTTHPGLNGALLWELFVSNQLARYLYKAKSWLLLKYLPHD